MANNADQRAIIVDNCNLVQVVSKHKSARFEQRRGLTDGYWREVDQLLRGNAVHPRNVSVDFLTSDDFQHVDGMNSSLGRPIMVDDEDVIPVVHGEVIDDVSH